MSSSCERSAAHVPRCLRDELMALIRANESKSIIDMMSGTVSAASSCNFTALQQERPSLCFNLHCHLMPFDTLHFASFSSPPEVAYLHQHVLTRA